MAYISTYNTYLTIGTKNIAIVDYPDMGSDPELIDVTTLMDGQICNIPGIKGSSEMTFNANFTADVFDEIDGYGDDQKACKLTLADGSELSWTGAVSVRLAGGGVNDKASMAITCISATPLEFKAGSSTEDHFKSGT